ncbi:MAG: hypothetical protein A2091_12925 [Desulfuromonadales bacterium GWD2_61_12]|nr:MAG: hypothetical protein A2005_01095 [Desulfuromonadales bacterium GWC2_61_20]OGR34615.1 MAG: hypothetical protein A2091_12925 [Desulfuromonadales bacterium GWD2_61_12]HAD03146.1 hypothetical protein [Desulfuromonas sp.]HBT83491.1 hypothetical protein [Desulfuromonas sp.]
MSSDPFTRLAAAIEQHQDDLPETLAAELRAVAAVGSTPELAALVTELARQVEDYDPYAGAGCFGDACSATTIAATLQRLKHQLQPEKPT